MSDELLYQLIFYAVFFAGMGLIFVIHLISMKRLKAADDRRAAEREAAKLAAAE